MTKKEKKGTSSKIWSFCISKKLALWLIIILALLSTIGMLIPQEAYNPQAYSEWAKTNIRFSLLVEQIQLNNIFKSYIFLVVSLVFTLNLIFCTIEQFLRSMKISRINKAPLGLANYSNKAEIKLKNNITYIQNELTALLKKKKYKISVSNSLILAEKWSNGIWGPVIFHIGLITIILGGLISNYFSMSGYFQISEGEVFQETHGAYLAQSLQEAPLFNEATGHIGYQIKLLKQERIYKGKMLDYTRSYVILGEKNRELDTKAIIEKGEPFEYKGYTFYHKDSGYSPMLKFRQGGKDIGSTYFLLQAKEIGKSYHYSFSGDLDSFKQDGYIIKVKYYPDLVIKENNKYDYNSMAVNNPAIYIVVLKNGQEIFKGLVKKDQWVRFNDFELSLGDTVYWVGLDVVKDPGANIIFLGFFISLLGLTVLYCLVPKRLIVELKENGLETICYISGRSRKYQLAYKDEFNNLIKSIEKLGR